MEVEMEIMRKENVRVCVNMSHIYGFSYIYINLPHSFMDVDAVNFPFRLQAGHIC